MVTLRFIGGAVFVGFGAALALLATGSSAQAALSGTATRVASGLSGPDFATFAPGDKNHLYVLERGGNVRIVDLATKTVLATPFLNIPDTDQEGEGGLLGLAFDPNYANVSSPGYGKFYTYVTVDNGGLQVPGGTAAPAASPFSTHIRQYSVSAGNPLVANTAATEVLSWTRPENNHVGGWIGFGPKDGYLYIDSGDGGNGNDSGAGHFEPGGNAQNITDSPNDLMGKQLRIDVNGDAFPTDAAKNYAIPATNPFVGKTGEDEIWSYGLRNPYRASFDRDTGEMWIGDVGQDSREEIDRQPAVRPTVSNYGWRLQEGNIQTPGVGGATPSNYVAPVYDYDHNGTEHGVNFSGHAVIGGYAYRGPDPSLQGQYFFADEVNNHEWEMDPTTLGVTNIEGMLTPNTGSLTNPSSYGEDAVGNLYIVALGTGSVFRINTTQLLAGDYNADGTVDAADYTTWRDTLGSTTNLAADGDHSGTVDAGDYTVWTTNFGQTVHTSGMGAAATVPEPATVTLVLPLLALLIIFAHNQQHNR